MPVRTKRIYDPPAPDDGVRVLVMRLYPRGVRRDAFDQWRRELGTAPELIRAWKDGRMTWPVLVRRFEAQMAADSTAQSALDELAGRARTGMVTLLCGCDEESRCDREAPPRARRRQEGVRRRRRWRRPIVGSRSRSPGRSG
jgi:uncharacterized protein YeaO (DUF488 family)